MCCVCFVVCFVLVEQLNKHLITVDYAVEMAQIAVFTNSGQVCCAGSRTFVQEKIYDEFVKKSLERASGIKIGNPLELKTHQGPQVCGNMHRVEGASLF